MSYCRFGEGDVYLFMHVGGYLDCCGCDLPGSKAYSTADMLYHLSIHEARGDYVPPFVHADLVADDAENFPSEES